MRGSSIGLTNERDFPVPSEPHPVGVAVYGNKVPRYRSFDWPIAKQGFVYPTLLRLKLNFLPRSLVPIRLFVKLSLTGYFDDTTFWDYEQRWTLCIFRYRAYS